MQFACCKWKLLKGYSDLDLDPTIPNISQCIQISSSKIGYFLVGLMVQKHTDGHTERL